MEIWKDIKGFEGLYKISNYGNIKSLERVIYCNKRNYIHKGKKLRLFDNGLGYKIVTLRDIDHNKHKFYVHRLVAEAFVNKAEGNDVVNHLDCNPSNNYYENLEWTTKKGNSLYMCKLGRNKRDKDWKDKLRKSLIQKVGKRVKRIDMKTKETKIYEYLNDTRNDGFTTSSVSECCNHKRNFHKGYYWEFMERV